VRIDSRFDTTVSTEGALALRYPDEASFERYRFYDAIRVAKRLDAGTVLLLSPSGDDALRIDAVDVGARQVRASLQLDPPRSKAAARRLATRAVEALRSGTSKDFTDDGEAMDRWTPPPPPEEVRYEPVDRSRDEVPGEKAPAQASSPEAPPEAQPEPEPEPEPDERTASAAPSLRDSFSSARIGAGAALAAAGGVGLLTSWGMWARLQNENDQLSVLSSDTPGFLSRQRAVDDAELPVWLTGAAGSAFATTAMPLLLPERDGVPWWAWASGAVGVGLAAWGLTPFIGDADVGGLLDKSCIDPPPDSGANCTRQQQTEILGGLLLFHAAPLVALPLTYLLRMATGSSADPDAAAAPVRDVAASVRVGRGEAALELQGRF
jgi:hypothetical protein